MPVETRKVLWTVLSVVIVLVVAMGIALALAYPSRYEGFGLPILEAMACGCPVITCRNSSLPEVGGDAALYVDPDDVEGMRQALLQALDPETRSRLVADGLARAATFTWQETARAIEDILSKLRA